MRCILLTCLCRSLYSGLLASVISFSVICVLWPLCGWQAFTWVMRQGNLFICCRGLPVELHWDTRCILLCLSCWYGTWLLFCYMRFVFIISGKRCDCDCGVTGSGGCAALGRGAEVADCSVGAKLEKGLQYVLHFLKLRLCKICVFLLTTTCKICII